MFLRSPPDHQGSGAVSAGPRAAGSAGSSRVRLVTLRVAVVLMVLATLLTPGASAQEAGTPRPTDPGAVEDAFTAPAADRRRLDTEHFTVHWVTSTADAATADYAAEVGAVLEEVWAVQVDELGWPPPLADGEAGGSSRVDVYLVELGDDPSGPFGYATADDVQRCRTCGGAHGYLVMDNDYVGFPPDPDGALRATAAHEFSHLVHLAIAAAGEGWAYEATAVWMEQLLYRDDDARTVYLRDFGAHPELPLTDFADGGGFDRAYGAYVWNTWLADRHGPAVVRDAWTSAGATDGDVLNGYDRALQARGTSFTREFVAFAAATASWEHGGFPSEVTAYPTIRRDTSLGVGGQRVVELDHTGYLVVDLADVVGPTTVEVRGPRYVRGGAALVAVAGDEVVTVVDDTLLDGRATVTLPALGEARVSLVVVNADVRLHRPPVQGSDQRQYAYEGVPYAIGVNAPAPVLPKER